MRLSMDGAGNRTITLPEGPFSPLIPLDVSSVSFEESVSPKQRIAYRGMMLRVLVGSGVHGTSIDGQDDRDEMGVCVEPMETVIGHRQFEHYSFRTQPEGVCSGPGDLDFIAYGLRKYLYLATSGNPTTLLPLFVPQEHVCYENVFGQELRGPARSMILSRRVGPKFAGYLKSQRDGLMGLRSGGTRNQGRADIRKKYGFDTKFAMHMVRLGLQGVELLKTGTFTLPIPEPHLTWLRDLRVAKHTKQEALEWAADLEEEIRQLSQPGMSPLPTEPDLDGLDEWVGDVHRRFWGWD